MRGPTERPQTTRPATAALKKKSRKRARVGASSGRRSSASAATRAAGGRMAVTGGRSLSATLKGLSR